MGFISCASLGATSVIIVVRFVMFFALCGCGLLSVALVVRFGVKVQPRLWTAYLSLRFSTHSAQVFVTDSELWSGECVSSLCSLCSVSTLRFCHCPLSVAICRASTWRRRVLCSCKCVRVCVCGCVFVCCVLCLARGLDLKWKV